MIDQGFLSVTKRRLQKLNMEEGIPEGSFLPKEKTIRAAAMNRKWRHFIDNSTLHGMQYVFNGQTKFRSVIWSVFLVMGTAYFVLQSSLLLKRYYSYEVTTKVTLKYEKFLAAGEFQQASQLMTTVITVLNEDSSQAHNSGSPSAKNRMEVGEYMIRY